MLEEFSLLQLLHINFAGFYGKENKAKDFFKTNKIIQRRSKHLKYDSPINALTFNL